MSSHCESLKLIFAVQSEQAVFPVPDANWPAGHEVQVVVPILEANVPTGQSTQLTLPKLDA